ncbi:MAG TPA: hypothetical protein VGM37_10075 [Armatimonadota bacterium]|jgi:uncharacterized repeat protein (TIGR01451 family)
MKPLLARGLIAVLAVAVLAAAPLRAQTPPVVVVPLARSCAFQLRLDQIAPTLYDAKVHGPLMDPAHRAALQWRKLGDATWKKGQDFVRVQADRWSNQVPEPRMATMIFGLKEDETYEYRVSFQGAGLPTEAYTGKFTTRGVNVPHGDAPTLRITTATANPSTAIKAVLSTTAANKNAVIQLDPNKDGAGKPVRTIFRTPLTSFYDVGTLPFSYSGAADGWLTLQGAPGADIVLDGSDPEYDVVGKGMWIPCTDSALGITASHRIYRTKAQFFDPANPNKPFKPGDALRPRPMQMYFEKESGGDAWRLLDLLPGTIYGPDGKYTSTGLASLRDRAVESPSVASFTADSSGYVYVRLNNGIDPNTVAMKIAVYMACLDISHASYVRVENIKFQYFRGWMITAHGGIHLDNVEHLIIENCGFKGLGYSIGNRVAAHTPRRDIVIKNCTFTERGNYPEWNAASGTWDGPVWDKVKGGKEDQHPIYMVANQLSVLDCYFQGSFNGITSEIAPQFADSTDFSYPTNAHAECWEIDNNRFFGISDDCVEVETYAVCIAATRNTIERSYKGWSVAPLIGGPQYFLRNTFIGRGEYGDLSYKQAMTKFGNDDPSDTGYKLCANNTDINVNDSPTGPPLVGLSCSGATYNTYVYNNYVACDAYPVDWGDGALGYPHVFNGNRYVAKRRAARFPGYGPSDCIAVAARVWRQGETRGVRVSHSWEDWQQGKDVREGVSYPGYQASPSDMTAYIHSLHSDTLPWMHDPDSRYSDGLHSLVDPYHGDFRPKPDSDAIGAGVPLANITYDCGPGWTAYEEAGRPTAGALTTGVPVTPRPNQAPSVNVAAGTAGYTGAALSVVVSYSDVDGSVAALTASVKDATGAAVASTLTNPGAGAATVAFTPSKPGVYSISATATDDKGAAASAIGTATVADAPVLSGNVTVTMTASGNAKPGEVVTYTIVCINSSNRVATGATLTQSIPAEMVVNAGAARMDGAAVSASLSAGKISVALGDMAPGSMHTITVPAYVK